MRVSSKAVRAIVEPSVLRWARESVGLNPVAASRKMRLADGRVSEWESGEAFPTVAELRRATHVYKRSLAVFYLSAPPSGFDTLRDFRRLQGTPNGEWSPALHEDFRRAHDQRESALELADLDESPPPMTWRIDPLPSSDIEIAAVGRDLLLGISPLSLPTAGDKPYDHLNAWVAAMEASGIMVMATAGGRVPQEEMRAFSLYFDTLPVVVVNGADSPRGRLFSLLHEYAHLLLHTEGLCDTITDEGAVTENRRLEARCNAIAAAMVMPESQVLVQPLVKAHFEDGSPWNYEDLREAAGPFGVSAEALLRRLLTLGHVSNDFYAEKRKEFQEAYERDDEARRARTGGNWYRNTVRDLGKGYVRLVTDAHRRRVIDTYTAATYLNVKTNQIDELAVTAEIRSAV